MKIASAVMFDLDDTLFDYTHSRHSAFMALKNRYNNLSGTTLDELDRLWNLYWRQLVPSETISHHSGIMHMRRERIRLILSGFGVPLTEKELDYAVKTYTDSYKKSMRPVPGCLEVLNELRAKNILIGVITNNPRDGQEQKLRSCGIEDYVSVLVASGDLGYSKPDPRIFQYTINKMGVSLEDSVMVGDTLEADILGAKRSGMKSIWLNRFGKSIPEGYDDVREIDSYFPIHRFMDNLNI
ncbi:MAG: HAD family hydrolase [Candidatus Thermoplasmatota archaeon]|nr:HAD family hydrolase [Candidatus Thermoplasmatota archaeon]